MKLLSTSLLLLATSALASAALTRTAAGGSQSLAINGAPAPEVISWSGGDAVGSVTTQPATGKKQITAVGYSPLVVETRLPLSPALTDCLADLVANRTTPRTLSLSTLDASGKTTATTQATNAILEEVRFPKLDASAKDSVAITFLFRVESIKDTAPETSPSSAAKTRQALTANFRLDIDGLPTNRIASVEAITVKRGAPGKAVEISDLSLAISSADEAGWLAWQESFLIKGENQDAAEKSGTLELLSPDMKSPIFTLKLNNLGLISLASPAPKSEAIARLNALLYVESLSLPQPASAPGKAVLDAKDLNVPVQKRTLIKP